MKNKYIYTVLFVYAILAFVVIYFFDGTGDSGDSIQHYLFAKYAPKHPQLFFDHWAKPLYVLLACPFAQFGFIGVKFFNVIVSLLTIFFTFKIAESFNLKNTIFSAILLVFSPLCFVLTFSGLTEPLFALFISGSLYAVLKQKYILACLLISFLPFVRSEGLIIIGIYAIYFILKREWKLLPLLLCGHILYSVAGAFVHHDLFWVFTKIPYAKMGSIYGSGELFHFVEQLIYVVGIPIYILFWLGIIAIIWKSVKKTISLEIQVFIFLGFLAFFIAHTLFWYLGIFNSMGLKRVLVGVGPLIAIIALIGFNFITEELLANSKNPKRILQSLLVAYVFIFPFTVNPAAIDWKKDMNLQEDQKLASQIHTFILKNNLINHRFVFSHPYLSEAFNIDFFNPDKRVELNQNAVNSLKSGDIIIWENWFALVEKQITKQSLEANASLMGLYHISITTEGGHEIMYSIYQKK